ncbi:MULTISPECIES: hypothetical protein [Acidithiobacillus]|jgi:hypothetical protein|uniref:hypothetical protein n=1 Tax=Acidithiobacillus TaxID=119977 RepID=UPI0004E24971|nr:MULTISPECIES: hypothetical protein [Acidithiobacillus]MDD2751017.1 hypothetical protein [Acidithiobacillus sp.]MDD5278780.1 hypothetical protein [Acidithiobacillus sp.]
MTREELEKQRSRVVTATINNLFLEFVEDGLTREELEENIRKNPRTWGRFSEFMDQLPSKHH